MKPLLPCLVTLALAGCALNLGGPSDFPITTVAAAADADADAATVAGALRSVDADVAFLVGPAGAPDWFQSIATATELHLSGPAAVGSDLAVAFLAMEPVGDTVVELRYEGGRFNVLDALYDLGDERFLDLLALRVEDPEDVRAVIGSLLQYMATDVLPSSAVALAVSVPSVAVGDSVARMLSPGYFDAMRCEDGAATPVSDEIRLFYGPEARLYCEGVAAETMQFGDWVRASLVVGRR